MRSKWKLNKNIIIKKKQNYSFLRNITCNLFLLNLNVKIHNGHKFRYLKIQKNMLNFKLGSFFNTRKKPKHPVDKDKKKKKK